MSGAGFGKRDPQVSVRESPNSHGRSGKTFHGRFGEEVCGQRRQKSEWTVEEELVECVLLFYLFRRRSSDMWNVGFKSKVCGQTASVAQVPIQ